MAALRRALLGAALGLALAPGAATAAPPVVLDAGHVDIGPFWAGEALRLQVKESDATVHELDDVVVRIGPEGRIRVPASGTAGKEWEYVGNRGEYVWRLPEDPSPNLLWAGFGNSPMQDLLRPFNVTLDGISGPGEVVLWAMGADAPFWTTRHGLPMARTSTGHFHMAWYVTQPGVYCLNLGASARRAAGGPPARARAQLTIVTATDAAGAPIDATAVVPCGHRGGGAPVATPAATPAAGAGGTPHVVTGDRYELRPRVDGAALAVDLVQFSARDAGATRRPEDVVFYQRAARQAPTAPWQSPGGGDVAQLRPGTPGPQLGWSTTRVPDDALDGDLRWRLASVDGPGTVTVDDPVSRTHEQRPVLGAGRDPYALWPGSTSEGTWSFSTPGVYCVGLEWRGALPDGREVGALRRLTFAIDAPPGTPAIIDPTTVVPCARPAGEGARRVIQAGHVDLSARVIDGRLELAVGDDTVVPRMDRSPSAVTLAVRAAARRAIPEDASFAFLGTAGDPVWVLPQTQDLDLLWPGWNTERIPAGTVQGPLRWTLRAVRGPGHVALWQNADLAGAPRVLFNTRDGVPDAVDVPVGTHAHGNWAFSREGVYCLDVTMSGSYRSGRALAADATLLVAVGAVDAAAASERDCVADTGPQPDPDPPGDPAPTPPASAPIPTPLPTATPAPHAVAPRLAAPKRTRLKARSISVGCQLAAAGRCAVRATVARATARRLGLRVARGARAVTIGSGSATLPGPGTRTVTVRLTAAARKALSRSKRSVKVTLTASAGGPAAARTLVLRR